MKQKINIKTVGTSFDRLLPCYLSEKVDFSIQMSEFADALLSNCPILLDFSKSKDTKKCNQMLAFLEGVLYVIDGQTHPISDESYLMGSKKAFQDGSLKRWIKEFGKDTPNI